MKRIQEYTAIAIIPLMVVMLLCGINLSIASSDSHTMPFITSHEEVAVGLTEYKGFGVMLAILNTEGKDDVVNRTETVYNKVAGDIDNTWNGEMDIDEFREYEQDLTGVNGGIVSSDKQDDYIEYTFNNSKKIKVNFKESDGSRIGIYSRDIDHNKAISHTVDGNTEIDEYEGGVIKRVDMQITKGEEALEIKMNYKVDIINLIIHYVIALIIAVIIYIAYSSLKVRRKTEDV